MDDSAAALCFEPEVGEVVVHPDPVLRTVSIGRITGAYVYGTGAYVYGTGPRGLHTRTVEWQVTNLERKALSAEAQQDISQRTDFFEVKRADAELSTFVDPGPGD